MLLLLLFELSFLICCYGQNTGDTLVKEIDFKVEQFRRHNTVKFYNDLNGVSDVILRRGETVEFGIELNKPYNNESIQMLLTFEAWRDRLVIDPSTGKNGWSLTQVGNGSRIDVNIHIPGNASVGVWTLQLFLRNKRRRVVEEIHTPHRVVVLFNPWSSEDAAYFPQTYKLKEYLMNEEGYTYSFDYQNWRSTPWIYGQFQKGVLDAILFTLDRSKLSAEERGNIVLVSRALTYLLNDDGYNRGVIQGRWKEPYGPIDGRPSTKPWEWTGSPQIFKEYMDNNGATVGYAQCWVFAGLLTTTLRALGIAARPVSNFVSAHSTNGRDLKVDIYLDKKGNIKKREMIWNFHVWVQGWFSRQWDLGREFDGWQELDATPQELSERKFQVGPASNIAIRNSQLKNKYQTDFLYEQVNANEVTYSHEGKVVHIDRTSVGLAVLTKKYGSEGAEDITRMYKPKEGTAEERKSYDDAVKSLGLTPPTLYRDVESRAAVKDAVIKIHTGNFTMIGSPITVKIDITNPSSTTKVYNISFKVSSMYYNGETANVLREYEQTIPVKGLKTHSIKFQITPEQYIGKLAYLNTISIEAAAKDEKTLTFKKTMFSLKSPNLSVYTPKSVAVNETFTMLVNIKNPFNRTLRGGFVAVEGTRMKRKVFPVKEIDPFDNGKVAISLQSFYAPKETLVVKFYSQNLIKMGQAAEVTVSGQPVYQFAKYLIKKEKSKPVAPETNATIALDAKRRSKREVEDEPAQNVTVITKEQHECCEIVQIPTE